MSLGGVGRPSRKGAVQYEFEFSPADSDWWFFWDVRSEVGVMELKVEVDCKRCVDGDIRTEEVVKVRSTHVGS